MSYPMQNSAKETDTVWKEDSTLEVGLVRYDRTYTSLKYRKQNNIFFWLFQTVVVYDEYTDSFNHHGDLYSTTSR